MSANDEYRPDDFPSELKPFEASLGSLVPAASRVDRDRLMYLAGAASATDAAARDKPNGRIHFRGAFFGLAPPPQCCWFRSA